MNRTIMAHDLFKPPAGPAEQVISRTVSDKGNFPHLAASTGILAKLLAISYSLLL